MGGRWVCLTSRVYAGIGQFTVIPAKAGIHADRIKRNKINKLSAVICG
jgi:hypothetical protein